MKPNDQHELLRRSYHESFFVKNTPVTSDEQVTAWLGVNRTPTKQNDIIEKASSVDENEKRKSILKRSPSMDSNTTNPLMNTKTVEIKKAPVPQPRNKVRVKDSLEVINAKLFKELDIQVNNEIFSISIDYLLCLEKNCSICTRNR
jgi:hypothetical protein